MATEQELLQALMRADRAGDTEGAQVLADMIKRQRGREMAGTTDAPAAEPDRTFNVAGMELPRFEAATSYLQGIPFVGPAMDEVAAGLYAPLGALQTGESLGEAYRGIKSAIDANTQRYREENPGKSLAIELGTSLTPVTGAANLLAQGGSRAARATEAVGRNVAEGAASGIAASDRNSIEQTIQDALIGGGLGVAGGALDARTALRAPTARAAAGTRSAAPSVPAVAGQATQGTVARASQGARGFPLTPGEIRARDSGYTDIGGMREENAARRGLLGSDAEQTIAEAELARDEFVQNALLDGRPLALDVGEASEQTQEEVLRTVERMRRSKNEAYQRLQEFEPFVDRRDLAGALRQTRDELLEPPTDTGFRVPVSPESIEGMPHLQASMQFLQRKLGRVMPDDSNLLSQPGRGNYSIAEIEDARRFLEGQATRAGQTDPNEARIIRAAKQKLDEATDELYSRGAVRSSRGDADEFRAALADARQANREYMSVVDGKVEAGRRRVKTRATRLVEDLQAGNVTPTTAVDRVITSTGRPKAGGAALLEEITDMAPQSAAMFRGAVARRLFGNALDVADDGSLRIADRRALLNRLETALGQSADFFDQVMGPGWTAKARELLEQSKPSRVDIGRAGNRFDPMNPSGSGSMQNLYSHLYTGLRAISRGMFATRVLAPGAAAVSAVASGMREAATDAAGSRIGRAVTEAVAPERGVLPEEFVTQWRALAPTAAAGSISTSGGQAATAERERLPQPSLL